MDVQKQLLQAAKAALANAYAPYSEFSVGAALQLNDGTIIQGVNVENASYGLTNCAERSALFAAYSQGYRQQDIQMIAITTNQNHLISPCGACRQVMLELLTADCPVILANVDQSQHLELACSDLLPHAFKNSDLINKNV